MNAAVQNVGKPPAWWKAIGQSVGVLYAPFAIMVGYTLLAVPCPHCKKAVWEILPLAPGLLPSMVLLRWISDRLPEAVLWVTSGGLDLIIVAGLACLIRRGARSKWIGVLVTLALSSILAVLTLLAMRA